MAGYQYDASIANRLISDLMRDFGLTREQAIGFTGALAMESHGFDNLNEFNPDPADPSFGYAQWKGPRKQGFNAFVEANGLEPSSYEANYGYIRHELQNKPGDTGGVLKKLQAATTPEQATEVVTNAYLRPGKPQMSQRKAWTAQVAQGYTPTPPANIPSSSIAQGAIQTQQPTVPPIRVIDTRADPKVAAANNPQGLVPPANILDFVGGGETNGIIIGENPKATRKRPEGTNVDGVVLHHTGSMTLASALNASLSQGSGAHFYIDRDGSIVRWTPIDSVIPHIRDPGGYRTDKGKPTENLGNVNTIGIEYIADDEGDVLAENNITQAQKDATATVMRLIADELGYVPGIIAGHGELQAGAKGKANRRPLEGAVPKEFAVAALDGYVPGTMSGKPVAPKPGSALAAAAGLAASGSPTVPPISATDLGFAPEKVSPFEQAVIDNRTIAGLSGNDALLSGRGQDVLRPAAPQVPPLAGFAGNDRLRAGPMADRLAREPTAPTVPRVPPATAAPVGQSPTNWPALYAQFGIDAVDPLGAPGKTNRAVVAAPAPSPAPGKQDRARPAQVRPTADANIQAARAEQNMMQRATRPATVVGSHAEQPIVVPPRAAATVDPALLAAEVPAAFTRPNRGDPAGTAVVQPARLGDSGQFRNTGKPTIGDPNMVTMPPPKPATATPAPAGPTILAEDDPLDVALRTRAERVRNQKPELATNLNYRPGDMMTPDASLAAKGFDLDTTLKNRAEKAKAGKDKSVSRGTIAGTRIGAAVAPGAYTPPPGTTVNAGGVPVNTASITPPSTSTPKPNKAREIIDATMTANPIVVPKKITVPPITPLPDILAPTTPTKKFWGYDLSTKKPASTRVDASQDAYTPPAAEGPKPIRDMIDQMNSPGAQEIGKVNEGMNPLLYAIMSLLVPRGEEMKTLTEMGVPPTGRTQVSTALSTRRPGPLSSATSDIVARYGSAHGNPAMRAVIGDGNYDDQSLTRAADVTNDPRFYITADGNVGRL